MLASLRRIGVKPWSVAIIPSRSHAYSPNVLSINASLMPPLGDGGVCRCVAVVRLPGTCL